MSTTPDPEPAAASETPPAYESVIDIEQIGRDLLLTPSKRLEQYLQWMKDPEPLRAAGIRYHPPDPRIPAGPELPEY